VKVSSTCSQCAARWPRTLIYSTSTVHRASNWLLGDAGFVWMSLTDDLGCSSGSSTRRSQDSRLTRYGRSVSRPCDRGWIGPTFRTFGDRLGPVHAVEPVSASFLPPLTLRPHQQTAVTDVMEGFKSSASRTDCPLGNANSQHRTRNAGSL
jgi:hypothetical protein